MAVDTKDSGTTSVPAAKFIRNVEEFLAGIVAHQLDTQFDTLCRDLRAYSVHRQNARGCSTSPGQQLSQLQNAREVTAAVKSKAYG